ncbi:sprouty-related, EVH1 domain-containing protein 2-like [Carcharodon carcharias]|uniref:sprouty-related, EVH1 domain-containing protein 2-like n=1 Tax=Carcharodon carcharias TaxID=13397 RepID=UPI001B7ED3A4|nr:sprouty-related, EVH1 domain-containing protein 2-like [Carcharodon carcharias]
MDQDYVVRVRAVVMTRDDSSGGWVPLGGAGLSHVMICRAARSDENSQSGFLIRGERLRDQAMILECGLKKDLIYNKVNPIFHHWKVDDDKFGLTFQSPADAITFERSIKNVIEELAEGSLTSSSSSQGEADATEDIAAIHTDSESSSNSRKEMLPKHITIVTSESSSSCYIRSPASDEFRLGLTQAAAPANQNISKILVLQDDGGLGLWSILQCRPPENLEKLKTATISFKSRQPAGFVYLVSGARVPERAWGTEPLFGYKPQTARSPAATVQLGPAAGQEGATQRWDQVRGSPRRGGQGTGNADGSLGDSRSPPGEDRFKLGAVTGCNQVPRDG